MGTIKGQNLRMLIENVCVAASTNCVGHLSLNVQESDTKDDVENWIVQEPVGHSWDAQVDAMVDMQPDQQGSATCTASDTGYGYNAPTPIALRKGDGIRVISDNDADSLNIVILTGQGYSSVASGTGRVQYQAIDDVEVFMCSSRSGAVLTYAIGDTAGNLYNFLAQAQIGTPVTVKFATTVADTHRNRDVDEVILQGDAIISDIQINAPNQDISTYSVKLTGTGSLSIVE